MALFLAIVLATVVVGSVYFFSANWLPYLAAASGGATDRQLALNLALLGAIFVATHMALAIFIWRYRDPNRVVSTLQPQAKTEIAWALAATVLFVSLNIAGARLWARERFDGPARSANPTVVEVTGVQFRWYFRYPGPDGIFGRLDPTLIDASLGNPLGIDREDPAAKDDVVTSELVLANGREVELHLRAHDVIHSFFVPTMRLKQDAVPGMDIVIHFTPTKPGTYDIACAELCGLGHYQMNAKLKVLDEGMVK